MKTPAELRKEIVKNPYAWPGGYPLFAITDDGGCLCAKCCEIEGECIDGSYTGDGWHIVALDVNWEDDSLYCDHCGSQIESAYGE